MPNPNATLTNETIAAIAAGALPGVQAAAANVNEDPATQEANKAAAEAAAAAATEGQAASAAEGAQAAATEGAGAAAAQSAEGGELVKFLQAEVKDRDTQLLALTIEVRDLKAAKETMEATHNGLLDIARGAVKNMNVALGGNGQGFVSADALAVLAAHKDHSERFAKAFPVGGVASTVPTDDTRGAAAQNVTNIEAARARATRFNPK